MVRRSHLLMILAGTFACAAAPPIGRTLVADNAAEGEPRSNARHDERFFMLNVLWFKPDGGAAKYDSYLKAARPFVAKHGGKSDGAFVPQANIIGEFDADLVFFVEWPNQKAFVEFIQDPGYQAVSHLRKEAIRDSLLIRCRKK